MKEQKAFKVPEGYFESLENQIRASVADHTETVIEKESINWLDRLIYPLHLRFSIPALMVILLVASVLFIDLEVDLATPLVMSDYEITEYLVDHYDHEIENELYELQLSNNAVNQLEELNDKEIMNYLYQEVTEEDLYPYLIIHQ